MFVCMYVCIYIYICIYLCRYMYLNTHDVKILELFDWEEGTILDTHEKSNKVLFIWVDIISIHHYPSNYALIANTLPKLCIQDHPFRSLPALPRPDIEFPWTKPTKRSAPAPPRWSLRLETGASWMRITQNRRTHLVSGMLTHCCWANRVNPKPRM